MNNNDEVLEYLVAAIRLMIDERKAHKQQCEDLAHEVLSLKNQLRDASAQIRDLHVALVKATGDVEAYKLIRKGGYISAGKSYVVGEHGPGQSGCRKEDAQECEHDWHRTLGAHFLNCVKCPKCGKIK